MARTGCDKGEEAEKKSVLGAAGRLHCTDKVTSRPASAAAWLPTWRSTNCVWISCHWSRRSSAMCGDSHIDRMHPAPPSLTMSPWTSPHQRRPHWSKDGPDCFSCLLHARSHATFPMGGTRNLTWVELSGSCISSCLDLVLVLARLSHSRSPLNKELSVIVRLSSIEPSRPSVFWYGVCPDATDGVQPVVNSGRPWTRDPRPT